MPMHFPAGPWMRLIIHCSNFEKSWQNDLWYKGTAAVPAGTDVQAVAMACDTAVRGAYLNWMPSSCSFDGVDAYINNGTYTVSGNTTTSAFGTGSGNALPTEDAAIVTISNGVGTRLGVGRIFVGGVADSHVTESKINDTGAPILTALMDALKGILSPGGVPVKLGVWQRKNGLLNSYNYTKIEPILGHRTKRRPRR